MSLARVARKAPVRALSWERQSKVRSGEGNVGGKTRSLRKKRTSIAIEHPLDLLQVLADLFAGLGRGSHIDVASVADTARDGWGAPSSLAHRAEQTRV